MLKTAQYPFNPLEGKKDLSGVLETTDQLKSAALEAMHVSLKPELRCVGALEDWS